MSDFMNDGTVVHGTRTLTLSNGYTYACDDWSIERPVDEIERTGPTGLDTGQVFIGRKKRGSATLQYSSTSTPDPEMGQTFTEDSVTYIIKDVSRPESKATETKCRVTFNARINASITVS